VLAASAVADRIRFHLDEQMPRALAHALRQREMDVTTARDAGLIGARDDEHLAFALRERRALITLDDDFLALNARGAAHAGIIYLPHGQRWNLSALADELELIHEVLTPDEIAQIVTYLPVNR